MHEIRVNLALMADSQNMLVYSYLEQIDCTRIHVMMYTVAYLRELSLYRKVVSYDAFFSASTENYTCKYSVHA